MWKWSVDPIRQDIDTIDTELGGWPIWKLFQQFTGQSRADGSERG